ncbi:MAG: Mini-ribonuclease 3 [Bacilli bacterium]|nr:Mini-ribonuclease 3 [Bacilli bacterium]
MNINLINPLVLAYIGDAVYELEIRKRLVENKINKVNELQKECTKYVSARGQASYMEKFINSSLLNEDELDIYKRARNSKVNSHPSNTDIITYKVATGFEALIGYLYLLNDMDKINKIIDYIMGD